MADRFCGNCGNELRPEDRFCPGCGKAVHETAVVPTSEADVPTPPPAPLQKADTRTRRPEGVADHFKRLDKTVKTPLAVAAIVGVIAVATQSGSAVLLAVICLIVAAVAYLREEEAEQEGTWLSDPPPPPAQSGYQQREPGVWSGVKIGFGMFIVLPILLILLGIVLLALLAAL